MWIVLWLRSEHDVRVSTPYENRDDAVASAREHARMEDWTRAFVLEAEEVKPT